jgi:membrane-associated phospholipid phosphatase
VKVQGNVLRRSQIWCAGFLSTILAVVISVTWLDKPIAYFAHDVFGQSGTLGFVSEFTGTPSFFSPLATFILVIFIVRRLAFRPFGEFDIVLIVCDFSIVLAKLIVPPLKFVFGRTWPLYHHPSLIGDGVYGFNFFHAGPAFESFPSGHMTSIFALVVVLWICYPRFWPTYVACMAAMGGALIAGNYHFLSDVIAGGFVGSSAAMLMVSIWEALDRRRVFRRVRGAPSS